MKYQRSSKNDERIEYFAERAIDNAHGFQHGRTSTRITARFAVLSLLVLALVLSAFPQPPKAEAHYTWHSYDCVWRLGVDHWTSSAKHRAGPIPDNPGPWDCTLWRSKVTTTNWEFGGRSGWTSRPNSTSYSNWQAAWYLAQSSNGTYCRLVRASARAKEGSIQYAWKHNYLYYQPSCWQD